MASARRHPDPYVTHQLPNGLTVVLRQLPHVESVSIGLWVRAGGRFESPTLAGTSHFVEHLVFKGTRTRTCDQLKQMVEGVGGSLNAFTAEEFTCYMAKVPARHLANAITALTDMALHPSLTPRDLEREREVILEEIRMVEDTPAQSVHDVLNQVMWPDHPLGNLLGGTEQSVRRITRGVLHEYWRRFYHPRHMLVACAGAVDPEVVMRHVRHAFAGAHQGRVQRHRPAPRPPRGPMTRVVRKTSEQTHVCVGTRAVPRTHPQRFALEVLHVLLGGNMSSRLFNEVREKRGLVYEIGTHIKRYQDTGAFVIYAGCDAAKLSKTLHTVVAELQRVRSHAVPPRELQRAKEFYNGQLALSLEDTMEHMLWIGEQAMMLGRVGTPEALQAAIARVDAEQVQRAARAAFVSPQTYLAVIGPVEESIGPSLAAPFAELR
jgi:predicted Zn-dependent peptidase